MGYFHFSEVLDTWKNEKNAETGLKTVVYFKMFTFSNLMLLIPTTYNCAIHKLITRFIKMLIYDSLQAVWSGQRT